MIGGSCSYGDRRFVFRRDSKSDIFNKKSDMARPGVIKFRSNDERVKSTRPRFGLLASSVALAAGNGLSFSALDGLLTGDTFWLSSTGTAFGRSKMILSNNWPALSVDAVTSNLPFFVSNSIRLKPLSASTSTAAAFDLASACEL